MSHNSLSFSLISTVIIGPALKHAVQARLGLLKSCDRKAKFLSGSGPKAFAMVQKFMLSLGFVEWIRAQDLTEFRAFFSVIECHEELEMLASLLRLQFGGNVVRIGDSLSGEPINQKVLVICYKEVTLVVKKSQRSKKEVKGIVTEIFQRLTNKLGKDCKNLSLDWSYESSVADHLLFKPNPVASSSFKSPINLHSSGPITIQPSSSIATPVAKSLRKSLSASDLYTSNLDVLAQAVWLVQKGELRGE